MTPGAPVEPTWLYRPYDACGRLLYVGIAADVQQRMDQHQPDPWYPAVAAMDCELYPGRRQAAEAETEAIGAEWPLWNLRSSPWGGIVHDRMRQLEGSWRQDKWGRWHRVPLEQLMTKPRAWKPHTWNEADERRLQEQIAHVRRVRRLTREAVRAAFMVRPDGRLEPAGGRAA